ncbi:hypothetical protein [Bradyrhizobium tropiciagri]|uniref:hypothetical protein n=1 Tax=Bradyrhizobium tropiciagri TaxID=312253 RepID=UPI0020127DB7|nr:hypothetical protein [Bradyrhizobium tropiciagri]
MLLLAAFMLLSVAGAGLAAILDPTPAPASASPRPAVEQAQIPVRIVGTPFIPNTNPRER